MEDVTSSNDRKSFWDFIVLSADKGFGYFIVTCIVVVLCVVITSMDSKDTLEFLKYVYDGVLSKHGVGWLIALLEFPVICVLFKLKRT